MKKPKPVTKPKSTNPAGRDFVYQEIPASLISSKSVSQDIAELKRIEKRLFHLAAIVESSDDAIISKTTDGTILSWNKAAEKLYGYREDEVLGKSIKIIVPEKKYREVDQILRKLRKGESIDHHETTRINKNGQQLHVSLTISPIRDSSGKIVSCSVIARDITERIMSETTQRFLVEAGILLSSSLDYAKTLTRVAQLSVPHIADWCTIDIYENNRLRRLVIAHIDPKKITLAEELHKKYPPDLDAPTGMGKVIRTGKSELYSEITDEMLVATIPEKERLDIVRSIGFRSVMMVPIKLRSRVLGIITFVTTQESGRNYTQSNLSLSEELSRRAGMAIENARLYRAAQEEIKERKKVEERLSLAQKTGNIGIFEWDIKTNEISWSNEEARLFDVDPRVTNGTFDDFSMRIHPDDQGHVLNQMENLFKKKKRDFTSEFRITRKNNTVRWLFGKGRVFYDAAKQPQRMVGVNIDITDIKNAEEEIRNSEHQLEIIFQNVADGITVQGPTGNLLYVNDAAARLCGFASAEGLMKSSAIEVMNRFDILDDKGRPFPIDKLPGRRALKGEKDPEAIFHYRDKKTQKEWWSIVKARAVRDSDGVPIFAVNIIHDITHHKHLEQRKDEFISMASHELRTPVTSLKAYTQLLEKRLNRTSDSDTLVMTTKINNQINKLSHLINDLLNLSRIQTGKIEFRNKRFDLKELVKETVHQIQAANPTYTISVKGSTKHQVFADKERIAQVISNLLTNAVKYSPRAKHIQVTILEKGANAFVSVTDHGIGIADEHKDKIFNRFYQTGESAEKTFPGLGIGLYISSEIVKRYGGEITVKSEIGKGSCFTFSIPIKE